MGLGLHPKPGWALDIGCSVGRLTFEMTKSHHRAVGVDTSLSFVRAARNLAAKKHLSFELVMEGLITEPRACELDPDFKPECAEFIVADAMALPFRSSWFAAASSVNILEKVPDPARHLSKANRVMDKEAADFLFSDPFSWDESVNRPELWLGAQSRDPLKGSAWTMSAGCSRASCSRVKGSFPRGSTSGKPAGCCGKSEKPGTFGNISPVNSSWHAEPAMAGSKRKE